jgi:hypothetical protein
LGTNSTPIPINEPFCILRIKGRFLVYSHIKKKEAKDQIYEQLEGAYSACPKNDVNEGKQFTNRQLGDTACIIVQTKTASD